MRKSIRKDSAAQVSAELIVVLAAVLAVALIAVSSLRKTAVGSARVGDTSSDRLLKAIRELRP